jgi:hypothetical protein
MREWPSWVMYTAPLAALLGFAVIRSTWVYHRYGKEAERRCKKVRGVEAHGDCVAREMKKMGYQRRSV